MMESTTIKVNLSREERIRAKEYAKSKGMTFQGWLAQIIRRELQDSDHTASSAIIPLTSIRSADGAALYKEGE